MWNLQMSYKKMMKSYYSQVEEPSKQKSKTEKADKAEKKKKVRKS